MSCIEYYLMIAKCVSFALFVADEPRRAPGCVADDTLPTCRELLAASPASVKLRSSMMKKPEHSPLPHQPAWNLLRSTLTRQLLRALCARMIESYRTISAAVP
jgi:hypothetical protein